MAAHPFTTVFAEGILHRLFVLRLYAVAGQAAAIAIVHYWLEIPLPLAPMGAVVGLFALLNLATWVRLRQPWPITALEFFAHLLLDVAALTLLLFYSGGSTNPFASLYLLPIIIAAIALPAVYAWAMTAVTVAAYSFLMAIYVPLNMPHGTAAFTLHLAGMWLNFIVSAVLIAFFIGRMAASIRSRDQELAAAREDALRNERVIALGSLAAGAAHELGTPLATMAVLAGEMARQPETTADMKEDLALLREQIDHCKGIITGLAGRAGQSRAEGGRASGIDRWLEEIIARWKRLRPHAGVDASLHGASPAPQVVAEATLEQALLALFNNAADACSSNVEIEAEWDAGTLRVEVRDRGAGIDEKVLLSAGGVFITTRTQGAGIGLFLAHAAVERFGGRIVLANRDGGGAVTRIELPLDRIMAV